MYRQNKMQGTSLQINTSREGETIEMKVERIVNNSEPISDSAKVIYTERKHGVLPEYDPRTDRFDVAIEAMDKVDRSIKAKRQAREEAKIVDLKKDIGGAEPTQGTT